MDRHFDAGRKVRFLQQILGQEIIASNDMQHYFKGNIRRVECLQNKLFLPFFNSFFLTLIIASGAGKPARFSERSPRHNPTEGEKIPSSPPPFSKREATVRSGPEQVIQGDSA